jgi:hypothetical protein
LFVLVLLLLTKLLLPPAVGPLAAGPPIALILLIEVAEAAALLLLFATIMLLLALLMLLTLSSEDWEGFFRCVEKMLEMFFRLLPGLCMSEGMMRLMLLAVVVLLAVMGGRADADEVENVVAVACWVVVLEFAACWDEEVAAPVVDEVDEEASVLRMPADWLVGDIEIGCCCCC